MARLMSFAFTVDQIRDQSKTVTRRTGWRFLQRGEELIAVEKGMGLKKGEKVNRLARIHVTRCRRERLDLIDQADVEKEGFPEMTPAEFIEMFCRHNGGTPDQEITRIEFRYLEVPPRCERFALFGRCQLPMGHDGDHLG